jgi:cysteinyl-tRNA synthetase
MKLHNTLTRTVEDVAPLNPPEVTVYTCGPTVYDYAHIGHWFNYIRMDTLIRALKANNLKPKWVMNITDVGHLVSDADEGEDKLEKGARREGKTAWEVAKFYTNDFLEGMQLLNILQPDHLVKATEHIPQQIELIERLEKKGYTYVIDDGVYYDTSKFPGYADFARLDLDEQQEGARVTINRQKRNRSDFALWKFSPKDHQRDMEWDSPWRKGFPGWHIECSAMSMHYLGDTLDIHTGGIDHIPVHHTNEIAQSEAATGKRFTNMWMHSNHVMVNGEKISKSLGNGIRLQEIMEKGISPMAVRLNVLESHYRSQSKFSLEGLVAAQNRLKDYQAVSDLQFQPAADSTAEPHPTSDTSFHKILEQVSDDLDTPAALATLSARMEHIKANRPTADQLGVFKEFLTQLDGLFGLQLSTRQDISKTQKQLIQDRETVREQKDWVRSDELRSELSGQGIGVHDTDSGSVWYRL